MNSYRKNRTPLPQRLDRQILKIVRSLTPVSRIERVNSIIYKDTIVAETEDENSKCPMIKGGKSLKEIRESKAKREPKLTLHAALRLVTDNKMAIDPENLKKVD